MKRITILTAVALSTAAVAYADPVTVETPKAPISVEAADAYVAKLEHAVKEVCYRASSPVIGVGFYDYLACIKATRANVAKQDPTGLYARRDSVVGEVFAAK